MSHRRVLPNHKNALYLCAALSMIFMTLMLAMQPLYLRLVLDIPLDNAGFINSNIQVMTEVVDVLFLGGLGYLSDKYGRLPVIIFGFLVAGITAALLPFSLHIGLAIGVSGLVLFYIMRIIMSLGTSAVWPQLTALAGDFSSKATRPRLIANAGFMMAFGSTITYAILMQIPQHSGIVYGLLLGAGVAFVGALVAKNLLIDVAPKAKYSKMPVRQVVDLVKKEDGLRLTFLAAFSSRNDMVIIGLFLMIWFVYFSELTGIGYAEATARAGVLIGVIGFVTLISIPLWGSFIESRGSIPAIAIGLALSGLGFFGFAFVVDPFSYWVFLPAILVASGQGGCLLAPQTLTIDLTPDELRGSTLGAFNTVGAIGVIVFLQTGGILFDHVGPPAPFLLTGVANLLVMGYALFMMGVIKKKEAAEKPVSDLMGGEVSPVSKPVYEETVL